MKKLKIMIIAMLVLCFTLLTSQSVNASKLGSNELLIFRGYTITKTTTINDLKNQFGEPKIVGKSAFGGSMYSWYDDNESEWFLGIETDASGTIKGYGCVYGDFVSSQYTQGDNYLFYYSGLSGTVMTDDDDKVIGVYKYNYKQSDIAAYLNTYMSSSDYMYDLQAPSLIVSKIITLKRGYAFEHEVVSDEFFYMNENLKANGSNFEEYISNTGKGKYLKYVGLDYQALRYQLPNPLMLGDRLHNYRYAENFKYILYNADVLSTDLDSRANLYIVAIDPDFLNEKEKVELTEHELDLLQASKEQFDLYMSYRNSVTDFFDVDPVYKTTPLVAGKATDVALNAATAWINIARAGLGENLLELDKDIVDAAQHKATIVEYMHTQNLSTGHQFAKPDEVDQDFYDRAMEYYNENLYNGNFQSSITNALLDNSNEPEAGHRYNLIDPGYTKWGVGTVGEGGLSWGWQSCHKFGSAVDYNTLDNELVAWPSNGIFPMEFAWSGIGYWTAVFYKNYYVTDDTEVTVKCLNNGKVYEITNENKDENGKFLKKVADTEISFKDDTIVYEDGDVFEITLSNIKNRTTGELSSYTYRSAFVELANMESIDVTDITLNSENMTILTGNTDKIDAIVAPSDASNKLLTFASSNENVVTVRQDGTLYAKKAGKATITIKSNSVSGKTKQVQVTVKNNLNDPDYLKGDIDRNGVVNANDAAVALDLYKYENATDEDILIGDIDENGVINANDAALILDIYKYGN